MAEYIEDDFVEDDFVEDDFVEDSESTEETTTPAPLPQMEKELTPTEKIGQQLGALGRGITYGATTGTAPAIETAAVEGLGKFFKGEMPVIPGTPEFKQKVMERAGTYKKAKEQYPAEFGVGEFAGTAATGIPLSLGAAKAGQAAARLAPQGLKGVAGLGTEAGLEAGIGAGISIGQGQDLSEGAGIGAGATVLGKGVSKAVGAVTKPLDFIASRTMLPEPLKREAVGQVPTPYQQIVSEAAESPEALKRLQSAPEDIKSLKAEIGGIESQAKQLETRIKGEGGLAEQLKTKQSKEESQFEQARKAVEEANKIKQADYDAALKEEDIAQKQMVRQTIEEVKNARSAEAANKLAESVNRGLNAQKQKAVAKYDIAFNQMIDQVQPKSSQILKMRKTFKRVDPELNLYAVETNKSLRNSMKNLKQDALTGAWTQGKEFKSMVEMDQAISADLRRLKKLQNRESSPNVQRAIDQLETVKMQLDSRLNSAELGLEGDVLDQYNEAKAHYADFAKMRDELFEAKLLAPKRSISGVKKYKATAESASKFLQPKVEDTERTARVQDVMQRLPGDVEDSSALTPAQFAQLRQQATGPVPPLLPERTRPEMPRPALEQFPIKRAITPQEQALEREIATVRGEIESLRSQTPGLEAQIEQKRPMAEAYKSLRPLEQERTGLSKLTAVRPQSALEKIERAQFIEQNVPNLARSVQLILRTAAPITENTIRNLAKQHQVDPADVQAYIESKQGGE